MAMSEQAKARLREIGLAKRAKKRLLKDIEPGELAIGCDYAEEVLGLNPGLVNWTQVRWLKYASPQQVEALQGRIPSVVMLVQYPGPTRRVVPRRWFHADFLSAVLKFVGVTNRDRYMSNTRGAQPTELETMRRDEPVQ